MVCQTLNVVFTVLQVVVTAPSSHPFFVYGGRWSSASPAATKARYGLEVDSLRPGDVCISLTQPGLERH